MNHFIRIFNTVNNSINDFVWGPVMLILLISVGLFLTVTTGFLQFHKFGHIMKNTLGSLFQKKNKSSDKAGVTPFQAVATALAGTIGTGAITGIATAIVLGGPGAIFWMWVSALLGMVTKYSEIVLSLHFREKNEKGRFVGGPMYYLQNGLKCKWLAVLFALFTAFACFGTGNTTQSNSIATALKSTLNVPLWVTGIVLTLLVGAVILGGMRRISAVNEKLVPFMAVFYVVCSVICIALQIEKVPAAFALIFKEAFHFKAAAGGITGTLVLNAMHYGFARGIFSNEAGLGSAPIAHAASTTKEPVKQGFWGVFEVFFTTMVICTMTALVILTTDFWSLGTINGSALAISSFDAIIPKVGGLIVTLSTIFFALSTILGWAYYGEVAIEYLFKKSFKAVMVYRVIFVLTVFLGCVGNLEVIWTLSETMNGLMAIPNLIGIVGLYKTIQKLTRAYFESHGKKKKAK